MNIKRAEVLFALVLGIYMLVFSGLLWAGEMEGEDAPDLEGNARLKAVAVCRAAGAAAVSDDTGLEVDALDEGPGAGEGEVGAVPVGGRGGAAVGRPK